MARELCEPTGLWRGNDRHFEPEVDLRVTTLAQRLAEEAGGELDQFALRGFSNVIEQRGCDGDPEEDETAHWAVEHYVLGAEDSFLDGFTAVPFRYAREAGSAGGRLRR